MTTPRRADGGAQSELLVVPAASVVPIPAGATIEQAATLPMNGLTAFRGLELLGLDAGATLLVTGGAGLLASYVIPIAKLRGLRVLADAAPADEELVRGFGADVVVPRGDDCVDAVLAEAPGGVDAVYDTALMGRSAFPAIRAGGALAYVRTWDGDDVENGITIRPVRVAEVLERTDWLRELSDLAARGVLAAARRRHVPARAGRRRAPADGRRRPARPRRHRLQLSASIASIRCGPGSANAVRSCSASSSHVVARVAGTPMPVASATKSRSGRDRSSSSPALPPVSAAPTRCSSMRRIAYERLFRITVVTFSCSRACVHSAVSEYIALPSDSRQSTGRSGHATAAPVATGRPCPIAPPVTVRMSWRGEPAVAHGSDLPDVIDSSATIARSGSIDADRLGHRLRGQLAARHLGQGGLLQDRLGVGCDHVGQPLQRVDGVVAAAREHVHGAAVGHEVARPARIGEEGNGRARAREDQVLDAGELSLDVLGEIADALDRRQSRAALEPRGERLDEELRAGADADPACRAQRGLARRGAADQEQALLTGAQHVGDPRDLRIRHDRAPGNGGRRGSPAAVRPRHVRRQHQRRDASRRRHRGGDRLRCVGADVGDVLRRLHPAAEPAGEQLDVRVQRRVVLPVIRRVVADDVHDRREGAARVVQAGQAVGEARPEVQQGCRRAARHATEPVGGAGDDALVQSQHGAHLGHLVERCDEVHLGRARVAEADVDAAVDQRPDQRLSAVHVELSLSVRRIPTT